MHCITSVTCVMVVYQVVEQTSMPEKSLVRTSRACLYESGVSCILPLMDTFSQNRMKKQSAGRYADHTVDGL